MVARVRRGFDDFIASFPSDPPDKKKRRFAAMPGIHHSADLDYELFPVYNLSYHAPNDVSLPPMHGSPRSLHPKAIATTESERTVWAVTGTTGPIEGVFINNPSFIRMAGSEVYQRMWPVKLDKNIGGYLSRDMLRLRSKYLK